ncbi:hypothetical protein SS50377_24669 [Spironucleus salmonicida]|uniref:Uncharacterized protein n=1 Tax=Spironucleus salmonicida TaxID=348837 RepID=A0A9P8LQT8_9EUKA|nr:hypothetical protein SS50377_24669 [Spironucleus salmonicida]
MGSGYACVTGTPVLYCTQCADISWLNTLQVYLQSCNFANFTCKIVGMYWQRNMHKMQIWLGFRLGCKTFDNAVVNACTIYRGSQDETKTYVILLRICAPS